MHSFAHCGIRATIRLISLRFVWPSMNKDITAFVESCDECQRRIINRHVKTPFGKYAVPSQRFELVNIDLIGPLPPSNGFRYCLTMMDRFTRWSECVYPEYITAETVTANIITHWIARFGIPARFTTDHGR